MFHDLTENGVLARIDRPVYSQRHSINADAKQGRSVSPQSKSLKPHKRSEQTKFISGLFSHCHYSLSNMPGRDFPLADRLEKRLIGITIQSSREM